MYERSFHVKDILLDDGEGVADNLRRCLEPIFYEIPDETVKSFIGKSLGNTEIYLFWIRITTGMSRNLWFRSRRYCAVLEEKDDIHCVLGVIWQKNMR